MASELSQDVIEFIERTLDNKLVNFEITVHPALSAGEGLQSVITFVSLRDKLTGKSTHLAIKQVKPTEIEQMKMMAAVPFVNEITYFTRILPALQKFQKSYPEVRLFDNFPKCYHTTLESGAQKLALENLTFSNYQVPPKTLPLDQKTLEQLFELFAEYHALSFAFKENQPEEFQKLSKNLMDPFAGMMMLGDVLVGLITSHFVLAKKYLEEEKEDKLLAKIDKYLTNAYLMGSPYQGPNGVFLHADCWTNNFMFKYNKSRGIERLQDIKLIDFQQGHVGPPVVDLSYLFYAGAGKESLDKLEYFLKYYHKHLTATLKKYGLDADKIYPYETLTKDWEDKAKFGFTAGVMMWKTRLAVGTTLPDVTDLLKSTGEADPDFGIGVQFAEKEYKKYVLDLIRHMDQHNYL